MIGLATVRQRGLSLLDVVHGLTPGLRFRLNEIISRISKRYGQIAAAQWTQTVLRYQARLPIHQLQSAIASGQLRSIESAIDPHALQQVLDRSTRDSLRRAAQEGGRLSTAALKRIGVTASFNAVHPNVLLYAQTRAGALVTSVPDDLRAAIRTVTALGAAGQLTVDEQARVLKSAIGIPRNQVQAPLRFGDELRRGDLSALSRRLSAADRQMIRSRIAAGTVTPSFIQDMQARYSERLIAARAETIARTETLSAINWGVHESWRQSIQAGELPDTARRMWIITPDEALCEICSAIPELNPDGVGMEEPFDTPEGPVMDPPAPHPNCRCSVGLIFPDVPTPEDVAPVEADTGDGSGASTYVPMPGELAPETIAAMPDEEILKLPSSAYTPADATQSDTFLRFSRNRTDWGTADYLPDRQALHEAIKRAEVAEAGAVPVAAGEQPTIVVLGGGPSSGKTVSLRGFKFENRVEVNADRIKKRIPEFNEGKAAGNREVSLMVHEESSGLSKELLDESLHARMNVLLDGTGDNSYESLTRKLRGYRQAGAGRVVGRYTTIDTETAVQRAIARANNPNSADFGRVVPEKYLRDTHRSISEVLPRVIREGYFDELELWDNNGGPGQQFLIARYEKGKGLEILDELAWQRFVAKQYDPEVMVQTVRRAGALGSSVQPDLLANYLGAYGQEWKAAPLPPGIGRGTPKECYKNATQLLLEHPDWSYVEGVAYSADTGDIPFLHAWLVTPEGTVVDPTWGYKAGSRYFGVRYDTNAYLRALLEQKHYGVLGAGGDTALTHIKTGARALRAETVRVPPAAPAVAPDPFAGHLTERNATKKLNQTFKVCPPVHNLQAYAEHRYLYIADGEVGTCRVPELPVEQRRAIGAYQNGDYKDVNSILRDGRAKWVKAKMQSTGLSRTVVEAEATRLEVEVIAQLERAMVRIPELEEPTVFWRGSANIAFREGDIVTDHGFTSLSVRQKVAEGFAEIAAQGAKEHTIVRVSAPRGTKGLWMPMIQHDLSEDEFLLGRGSRFRVLRIRRLSGEEYRSEFPGAPRYFQDKFVTIVDAEVVL